MSEERGHQENGRQPVAAGKIFGKLAKNEYLCTLKQAEAPIGRVVYRGNNNANANGGVSYANVNNDASNSNTNVGSRLDNNQRN